MSLPIYKRYVNSGAAWLGDVPEHWVQCRSDEVLVTSSKIVQPSELTGRSVFHYSIPVVQDTGSGQIEDGSEIKSSKLIVSAPQVIISKLNPRKGTVCIALPHHDLLTVCSGEFVPLVPTSVDLRFIYYTVISEPFRQRLEAMVESATKSHQRVLPADIVKFPWVIPPNQEQTTIAAFLDRETGKIDTLIEEQKRLIALLKEKRQAVIAHAVTKGLSSDALMKNSDVEWLGAVPEHWEVKSLRYSIASITSGTSVNAIDVPAGEEQIGVLKTSCVYKGVFEPLENKTVISDEYDRATCPVERGSVIVSRMNTPELVGAAGLVEVELTNIYLPDRLWQVRFASGAPAFFHLWMQTPEYRSQVRVACSGTSSSMQNLSQDQFKGFKLAVPPVDQQKLIVEHVKIATKMLDALVTEADVAIGLLQERRSALISAAVTGKIDVRDLVPNQAEAA